MKNNYFGIWALIAVAFIVILVVSVVGTDKLPGNLKSSEMAQALIKERVDTAAKADSLKKAIEKQLLAGPDTASKNILLIGDSMLEGLGPRMAAYAKKNGHTLNYVIWYSSTSEYWGTCDTLTYFINKFKPDYLFIALGANEMFVNNLDKRKEYIKEMLRQIGDIPYVWIGPPNWKPDTGINDAIAETTAPGTFFLSNGMQFERAKDHVHPTHASAALWLDSVARWMPRNSAHPIKMAKPDEDKARAESVTMLQPKHQ